jgi:glycosyltransferase involved in cell wall biosynthesis
VPHGISVPDAQPGRAAPSERFGGLHLGYLGSLAWQKGVHVLIEAVNGLPEETRLSIYGALDAFPNYVARLRRLARHPAVAFRGSLSRRDLWPALAQLDLLVVPSLWHETSSLVVQEAFACGVPVIASSVGALPEKIRHGIDGLLVPPGDALSLRQALAQVAETPGLLAELCGNIGPVRTLEDHGAEIEAIYRTALESSR